MSATLLSEVLVEKADEPARNNSGRYVANVELKYGVIIEGMCSILRNDCRHKKAVVLIGRDDGHHRARSWSD